MATITCENTKLKEENSALKNKLNKMNDFYECIKKIAELYKESIKIHKINFNESVEDITTNFLQIKNKYINNIDEIKNQKIIINNQEILVRNFLNKQINTSEYNIENNYQYIFTLYQEKMSNRYNNAYMIPLIIFFISIFHLLCLFLNYFY